MNYEQTIVNHHKFIYSIVSRRLYKFSKEDKEDITQDIIERLLVKKDNFDLNRSNKIKEYIYITSNNYVNNYLKKHRKIMEITVGDDTTIINSYHQDELDPERIALGKERLISLREILSEKERQLLEISERKGYINIGELHKEMKLSKKRIYQLLQSIKKKGTNG